MLIQQDLLVSELREIMTAINTSKEDRLKRVSRVRVVAAPYVRVVSTCRFINVLSLCFDPTCHPFFQIQKLRSILATRPELLKFRHSIRLPLDPSVKVTGILAEQASLFKSNLIPAKLGFMREDGDVYWVRQLYLTRLLSSLSTFSEANHFPSLVCVQYMTVLVSCCPR